jgi:hypothetical protein
LIPAQYDSRALQVITSLPGKNNHTPWASGMMVRTVVLSNEILLTRKLHPVPRIFEALRRDGGISHVFYTLISMIGKRSA